MPTPKLLNLDELFDLAERQFLLDGKSEFFFPVRKKSGIDDFYLRLEQELREQSFFSVAEYRTVKEGWAKVSRPSVLRLTRESLLKARPHLQSLQRELSQWRNDFSHMNVEAMIREGYREVIANPSLTRSCLEILSFLLSHRNEIKGLLPRQVQHSNSTKLIGREPLLLRIFGIWRSEPANWSQFFKFFDLVDKPVEFRFFASICICQNFRLTGFHGILAQDWMSDFSFNELDGTLIVENLETFHAESNRSSKRLILWGGGWKAAALRPLHHRLPQPIIYWGDIDKEGYEIYGYLKSFIPHLQSTLMKQDTIDRYESLSAPKAPFFGPYRFAGDLQEEYQYVCQRGICIEQEKIHDRPL